MIVLWSPHAETLLDDIVIGIAEVHIISVRH